MRKPNFSDSELRRIYRGFNKRFWNGELPEDTDILWHPTDEQASAYCSKEGDTFTIQISPSIAGFGRYTKLIIAHEMCHVATWHLEPHLHGNKFKKEWLRVLAAGAWKYC